MSDLPPGDLPIKYKYGITPEDYEALLDAQNGRCAICGTEDPAPGRIGNLFIDHDTGKIRGLLCHRCNVGIGIFQDDPVRMAAAITYLNEEKS